MVQQQLKLPGASPSPPLDLPVVTEVGDVVADHVIVALWFLLEERILSWVDRRLSLDPAYYPAFAAAAKPSSSRLGREVGSRRLAAVVTVFCDALGHDHPVSEVLRCVQILNQLTVLKDAGYSFEVTP